MINTGLNTFITVADEGSFSKAAEKLFISTTAVIKQINTLEESIKIKLFNRNFKGVFLTESGKSFYTDAKYILKYTNESIERARNIHIDNDTIRVGTSFMTPSHMLLELWPDIHNLYPDLKFKLVSFENTPENAKNILLNLGKDIDVVGGLFDETFLNNAKCEGLEVTRVEFCLSVPIHHPLASKEIITMDDLKGQNIMIIKRGWNSCVDKVRDEILNNHKEINIIDFPFYCVEVFNQCESEGNLLLSVNLWTNAHPLMKTISVDWDYTIPYGFLHSPNPTELVESFLKAIIKIKGTGAFDN